MKKIDFQKVVEWLSFALKCPVCNYKYNLERTKIIETKEGEDNTANLLVHTDCGQCKSSVVFSISINGPEIFSVGMITDLTSTDTAKFAEKQAITPEDVHTVHDFLENFDGDFAKALK